MIGRLQGVLAERSGTSLLVDVNGVGYEVQAPMTTVFKLPELGQKVTLSTHLAVSENAQTLYGFISSEDRALFRILIKVNGVGPKMAVAILSGMESRQLAQCVIDDNITALVKIPGVGKKTAERLMIELRDRLQSWMIADDFALISSGPDSESLPAVRPEQDMVAEAESALVGLGYKPVEASKVVAKALKEGEAASSEELIRRSLKSLVPA